MIIGRKVQDESALANVVNRKVHVAIGIDVGSTETRVSIADEKDVEMYRASTSTMDALRRLETVYVIPSSAVILERDNREIIPASQKLADNYDSVIIAVSTAAEKPMFSKVRVLRGRKIDDAMGVVTQYFDSSTDKVDNRLFYLNILDSIGYAIIQKYGSAGIPSEFQIDLCISVRPKELTQFCRSKMQDNLLGKFIFQWNGREINLLVKNLGFTTEPEAQISGSNTMFGVMAELDTLDDNQKQIYDQLCSASTMLHIEGGGSSVGVELVQDGAIVAACSSTFQLGGNHLAQMIADRVSEEMGIRPSLQSVNKAIQTCMLRNGRSEIDISGIVSRSKSMLAMQIFEDLRHKVIDTQQDLMLRDIEVITLGGRLFRDDQSGYSVAGYFKQYVEQMSSETQVLYIEHNYIPQGNMLNCLMDFAEEWEPAEEIEPVREEV